VETLSLQSNETKPFSLFESNGVTLTNYAQNAVVITSDPIPENHIFRAQDINTIFVTSGGTIAFEKVSRSGGVTRWAAAITANSNGSFNLMLMPGDKCRIVLTSTGSGVLDILWHGELQRIRPDDTKNIFRSSNDLSDGL